MQKGTGLEVEAPVGAALGDVELAQRLHRRGRLTGRSAKRAEVMLTEQVTCSRLHGRAIQRAKDPAAAPRFQRRAHGRLQQQVSIAPAASAVAGVKTCAHLVTPLHRHLRAQVAVGAAHPGESVPLDRSIQVHHLVESVHAGIGTAGADGGHGLVGKGAERLLQPILHRLAIWLGLPAVEGPAVVGDAERQALGVILHGWRYRLLGKPAFSPSLPAKREPALSAPRWPVSRPRPEDHARLPGHRSA